MYFSYFEKNRREGFMRQLNKHEKTLELPKILKMLSEEASCEETKEKAMQIIPYYSFEEAEKSLQKTSEAHMLVGRFGSPFFGKMKPIEHFLIRAQSGGMLTMGELLKIGEALRVFRSLKEWRNRSKGTKTSLDFYFESIHANKYFEEKIQTSIVSEEEMADNASPELSTIRRKIKASCAKVRQQLDKIIHSSTYQKFLQDPIITMREGRFVVPVKSEYRGEVAGLVHDTSSSGSTVFIEPMSVVTINNEIKVLQSKETAEIERVLFALSGEAGNFAESMINGYHAAIALDLVFAKANLAYRMKATLPRMNETGRIVLKKARHPLIDKDKIVPIDITLGIEFDTLVITGPNTGGKTVTLKTIGLLTLMAMCGMLVPSGEESELSVFNCILSDIGDEQSIEQSLSTFSSHMINIIGIMKQADSGSLVLLDELGAGTDPVEGAGLAMAILESLREKCAKIVATTHYAELKEYALKTEKVENACCEFDVETLRPTYRLRIGIPGRSNAFAISERLGLNAQTVEKAKRFVSAEKNQFEEIVSKLEKTRQELEQEREQVQALSAEARKAEQKAKEESEKIRKQAQNEIEQAKRKARELLDRTRAQTDALLEELSEIRKKNKQLSAEEKTRLKAGIRELENTVDPIERKNQEEYRLPRKLKVGDTVLIFDIDKKATVLEKEDQSGNVMVQAGIIKTRVPVSNLRLLDEKLAKATPQRMTRTVQSRANRNVQTELDLRGKTALEAILELDQFIDHAQLSGVDQLTVIHGKGTGVLRKEVQAHLKNHPAVKSFRLGVFGEGESGVTIVQLK